MRLDSRSGRKDSKPSYHTIFKVHFLSQKGIFSHKVLKYLQNSTHPIL